MDLYKKFVLCCSALGLIVLLLTAGSGLALAANLLSNGNFESFQSYNGEDWRGFPERYGQNWNIQVLDEDGLHFMDSDTFGQFMSAVFAVPYLNYRLEGTYSQAFASRRRFDFLFSRTETVVNGQDYAFGGKVATFWKGAGGEVDHTKVFKRIGVDPTGGTDHNGPNVIWTDWDGTDNAWTSPALAATAAASQMTLFIQVDNIAADVGSAHVNTGYIDNFKFELAPVASLNLPAQTAPGNVNVTWSVNIPDTGFWNLWGYDVDYRDDSIGTWQAIQSHSDGNGQNSNYSLTAEAGKSYTFRVRPWQQEKPNGSPITTAMPGLWQEKSITVGEAVNGRVLNHAGLGLRGATVLINGTATSATTNENAMYILATGSAGSFDIVANNYNGLTAPPPQTVIVQSDSATPFDIMLRPSGAGQGISNNDFEVDLSGWSVSNGGAANRSTTDHHTGQGSLLITGTTMVSQSNIVNLMDDPLLSFWYKSDVSFDASVLSASGAANTRVLPPSSSWVYASLESGLGPAYSGPVGVNFSYSGAGGISS